MCTKKTIAPGTCNTSDGRSKYTSRERGTHPKTLTTHRRVRRNHGAAHKTCKTQRTTPHKPKYQTSVCGVRLVGWNTGIDTYAKPPSNSASFTVCLSNDAHLRQHTDSCTLLSDVRAAARMPALDALVCNLFNTANY